MTASLYAQSETVSPLLSLPSPDEYLLPNLLSWSSPSSNRQAHELAHRKPKDLLVLVLIFVYQHPLHVAVCLCVRLELLN